MVQVGSIVNIVDNSGVRVIRCIKVLGTNPRSYGRVGNIIVGAVQVALPRRKIKVHDVCKCVIIRQKKVVQRKSGVYVSFDKTGAVVIDARRQPVATRIKGSSMHELRKRRHMKIISLSNSLV